MSKESNSIYDEIKEQDASVRNRSFKERMAHFWRYYKVHTLVAVAAIAIITYLVLKFTVFKPLPIGISVYALNSNYYDLLESNTEDADNFIADFAEKEGINTEENRVIFNVETRVSQYTGDNLSMAVDMNLVASGEQGKIDILIAPPSLIEYYIENGFYEDNLKELLSPEIYSYAEENDLIYYYEEEATGNKYALGLKVADAPKFKEINLYNKEDEPVLAFVSAYSTRTDVASDFVDYIFEINN